jgi:hypothetical protein
MTTTKTFQDQENTALAGDEEADVKGFRPLKLKKSFQIEYLRIVGLSMYIILLAVGYFVTVNFVEYPKGSGSWHPKETFIYKTFGFNHFCSWLDFNPTRSVAAILAQFCTVPMVIFNILYHYKIAHEYKNENISRALYIYSVISTPITCICFQYFFMVFVNEPYGTMIEFTGHYIPYCMAQTAWILSHIQQMWHLSWKKLIPFGIPAKVLFWYAMFLVATQILYTVFVISIILGHPFEQTHSGFGQAQACFFMYFCLVIEVVIPLFFAIEELKVNEINHIEFY